MRPSIVERLHRTFVSAWRSPYQQSDISALLQTSEPWQQALWRSIQHPRRRNDNSTMQECVQQPNSSGCLDSSPSREAQYHFLEAYAFSTLWTQCDEQYESIPLHIKKTSPEMPSHSTECILHHSIWLKSWSWSMQSAKSANLLKHQARWFCSSTSELHTTRPSQQGSWFLVEGFSSFAW